MDFGWGLMSKGGGLKGSGDLSFGLGATQNIIEACVCVHEHTHTHILIHTLSHAGIHTHSHFSPIQPMRRAFWARFLITHGNFDFGHLEEGQQS